jgi:hypothetical protein
MSSRQEENAARAAQVQARLDEIAHLHRHEIPVPPRVQRKLIPFPDLVVVARRQTQRGISLFDRAARREAARHAHDVATGWARQALAEMQAEEVEATATPEAKTSELTRVLAESGHWVRVGSVTDDSAVLWVEVADAEVPHVRPATTSSGNPTTSKVSKSERADWMRQYVAACGLRIARLALDAVPNLGEVRVVVSLDNRPVLAFRTERPRLMDVHWGEGAWSIVVDPDFDPVYDLRARTRELSPIALP